MGTITCVSGEVGTVLKRIRARLNESRFLRVACFTYLGTVGLNLALIALMGAAWGGSYVWNRWQEHRREVHREVCLDLAVERVSGIRTGDLTRFRKADREYNARSCD